MANDARPLTVRHTGTGSPRNAAPARPGGLNGSDRRTPGRKRADVIAEEIKRWIFIDKKLPGDRLPQEHELAKLFDASRWTIREALKSLEVQGLISVSSGAAGGARIADVSLQNAVQLLSNYFYFKPLSIEHGDASWGNIACVSGAIILENGCVSGEVGRRRLR